MSDSVIDHLNRSLGAEFLAIHQYYIHAKMYENDGLSKIAAKEREASIHEMKHADMLIGRILFLEGVPHMGGIGDVKGGAGTPDRLKADLKLEHHGVAIYRQAMAAAAKVEDHVTWSLLKDLIQDEEEHIDWLRTQLELIDRIGLKAYEQSQI